MDHEHFLDKVLATYDLSDDRRARMRAYFLRSIEAQSMHHLPDIYTFVSSSIEWDTVPWKLKHAKSLDATIGQGNSTFYAFFGNNDDPLEKLIEAEDFETPIGFERGLDYLEDELEETQKKIIFDLIGASGIDRDINPSRLLKSIPEIKQKIQYLSRIFHVNNRFVFPRKRIIVENRPEGLKVMVGKQDGDTVIKIYDGLRMGMNAAEAARYADVNHSLLRGFWFAATTDFGPLERNDPKDKKINALILEAHNRGMSYSKAAVYVGISKDTLIGRMKSMSLRPKDPATRDFIDLTDGQSAEIIKAYHESKGNPDKAVRLLHFSYPTIVNHWREKGYEPFEYSAS